MLQGVIFDMDGTLIDSRLDFEAMRKAAERMDQMRERLKERIGTVEVAADLIRDARNQ